MKKPILAVLLIALFGVNITVLAAEPTHNLKDKARSAKPVSGKGLVIQGNRLKVAPGYVLKKVSNNQVRARPAGGSSGLEDNLASCACQGGTGDCDMSMSGDVAICSRSPGSPCSGSCGWTAKGVRSMKVTPR